MTVVNIYDAKTQLSKLIEEEAVCHDVVIARGGKPVARLTRLDTPKRELRFGVEGSGVPGQRAAVRRFGKSCTCSFRSRHVTIKDLV